MDEDERVRARAEIVAIAKDMIAGRCTLLDGVRRIDALRHETGDGDNEAFTPIIAVDSETDRWPLGVAPELLQSEYRRRVERDMEEYIRAERESIVAVCREIIQAML